MNEEELETSISTYKIQLQGVEDALVAAGENAELLALKEDLNSLLAMSEESLLSLKKERLMSMLEHPQEDAMEDEFAAFQAALQGDVTSADSPVNPSAVQQHEENASSISSTDSDRDSDALDDSDAQEDFDLSELEGTKCRVPYAPEWGHVEFHNALILCAERLQADSQPKVRVLFCHPTKQALVTCPYFLESKCRFSEEECRFCHGYVVNADKLEEFQEPDYSLLKLASPCLAKYSDQVWYPGVVVEVPVHKEGAEDEEVGYQVLFEEYEETVTVPIEDIIPWDTGTGDTDSEAEENSTAKSTDPRCQSDDEDDLPVYLYKPQTTQKMGDWEKHTKGIGSKLMMKMGFIVGGGLGKTGQGRADPVPIQLLPQGKSLDKIMELKAIAGDQDLYDVLKKQKAKQKQTDNNAANQYQNEVEKLSVFDIINKKLGNKKGDVHKLASHRKNAPPAKHIGVRELGQKSNKDINIQLFQTTQEIQKVEKEVDRLKQHVQRTQELEPRVANQYKRKLTEMEQYLQKLKNSQNSIQSHKDKRRDHKKMAIF